MRRIARRALTATGAAFLAAVLLAAVFAPVLAPNDPYEGHGALRLRAPSPEFPLGTDAQGRCVLSRLLHGGRVSLGIAGGSVLAACVLGTVLGAGASLAGRGPDLALAGAVDVVESVPALLLCVLAAGALEASAVGTAALLAAVHWAVFARVARGIVRVERERTHVLAAVAMGLPPRRVLSRHVLPALRGPMGNLALSEAGRVLMAVGSLGFLGLGPPPPVPEWGKMVLEGRRHLRDAPWVVLAPCAALLVAVLATTLLAEGLRARRAGQAS